MGNQHSALSQQYADSAPGEIAEPVRCNFIQKSNQETRYGYENCQVYGLDKSN